MADVKSEGGGCLVGRGEDRREQSLAAMGAMLYSSSLGLYGDGWAKPAAAEIWANCGFQA